MRAEVQEQLTALLKKVNGELADYEKLQMLVVAKEPWSIENGCLTPTMKIKRSRIEAAVARAREFADEGDLRFAAELASHAVFADPGHAGAKAVLAEALTRLGYGSECATWRNNYLVGASEVDGPPHPAEVSAAPEADLPDVA